MELNNECKKCGGTGHRHNGYFQYPCNCAVFETLLPNTVTHLMTAVNGDVLRERVRQNEKWGCQRHHMGAWLAILAEEFGEVSQAMQGRLGLTSMKDSDADDLYEELIQVAAVASAIAEQVKEEAGGA